MVFRSAQYGKVLVIDGILRKCFSEEDDARQLETANTCGSGHSVKKLTIVFPRHT